MRMSPKIWFDARVVAVSSILSGTILAFSAIGAASAERDTEALLKDALSAAPPMIAKTAMVMDWDGTMLRQGSMPMSVIRRRPTFALGEQEAVQGRKGRHRIHARWRHRREQH